MTRRFRLHTLDVWTHPAFDGDLDLVARWLWLIDQAEWKEGGAVPRGALVTTRRKLGRVWRWDDCRVDRFLALLERHEMITMTRDYSGTTVHIVKYDKHQKNQATERATNEPPNEPPHRAGDKPTSEPLREPQSGHKNAAAIDTNGKRRATSGPPCEPPPEPVDKSASEPPENEKPSHQPGHPTARVSLEHNRTHITPSLLTSPPVSGTAGSTTTDGREGEIDFGKGEVRRTLDGVGVEDGALWLRFRFGFTPGTIVPRTLLKGGFRFDQRESTWWAPVTPAALAALALLGIDAPVETRGPWPPPKPIAPPPAAPALPPPKPIAVAADEPVADVAAMLDQTALDAEQRERETRRRQPLRHGWERFREVVMLNIGDSPWAPRLREANWIAAPLALHIEVREGSERGAAKITAWLREVAQNVVGNVNVTVIVPDQTESAGELH